MRKLDPAGEKIAIEKGIIKEGEEISTIFQKIARNIAQKEEASKRDYWSNRFFEIMDKNYFLPNFPTLINGASEDGIIKANLSACFVLEVEDSRKSIFSTLADAAEIQAMGGGTGFNFSKLRQKGAAVTSTGGVASGPVSFMHIYDVALGETIKQGGRRPGANMGCLWYHHPDILEFITIKANRTMLNNFNLSVLIDDTFIEKAKNGENFNLIEPHTNKVVGEMNAEVLLETIAKNAIENGCPGVLFYNSANKNNPFDVPLVSTNPCITGETLIALAGDRNPVSIKTLVEEGKDIPVYCVDNNNSIVIRRMRNPRKTGEKAKIVKIMFDNYYSVRVTENHKFILTDGTIKEARELNYQDKILTGKKREIELLEIDNNSLIVLSRDDDGFEDVYNGTVDEFHNYFIKMINPEGDESFICVKNCGETFLYPKESCVLGAINYKQIIIDGINENEIKEIVEASIRFLDNIIDINYYPLPGMKEIANKYRKIGLGLMGIADVLFLKRLSYSSEEARNEVKEIYTKVQEYAVNYTKELAKEKGAFEAIEESKFKEPRRNSYLTLQQPTGTLSILANCSAGIEPWFGLVQTVTTSKNNKIKMTNPILQQILKKKKLWDDNLIEQIENNNGSIKGIKSIPEELQDIFVTALDISYQEHISMQAIIQGIVDNSVSKTVNMNKTATTEDARGAILLAHHLGCKGLTIYKDGAKENQPISVKIVDKDKEPVVRKSRNKILAGQTEKIEVGDCGEILITINVERGRIREVILNKGHSGGCANAMMECIGRLITDSSKNGSPIENIINQLKNIKCDQVFYDYSEGSDKPDKVTSCPMAVALAIERFLKRNNLNMAPHLNKMIKCPKCGEFSVIKEGSCEYCSNQCGYSRC